MMQLREWLKDEPFTLTMSSGFFSFFAHCGMLSVLEDEGLFPQRVTGSSAGSLVAACWASGMNATEIRELFFSITGADIWNPGFGLGLLKSDRFRQRLRDVLPVQRLEQGRVPLGISVYDRKNKVTHSYTEGDLPTLVSASCAVPYMFHPVVYKGHSYLDGGIQDRPGLHAVPDGERVFYHHIVSRSPWRKKNDPALQIPRREHLTGLAIDGLTRSGPTKLHNGPIAYAQAREATQRALSQVLDKQGNLHITALPAEQLSSVICQND